MHYSVAVAQEAREADAVVDRLFAEPALAELYDLWDPWEGRDDFGFYLPLVMSAPAVLDWTPDHAAVFASGAGLVIEEQFGNWDRQPLTKASPEIITIARRGLAPPDPTG